MNTLRTALLGLTLGVIVFFSLYYALRKQAENQWDRESKLYIQGYLDGKYEVLDSLKSVGK
tara:strand:- start:646 stop:828 length:183 start_codon:yes stop_codon:yes gene_type:complete